MPTISSCEPEELLQPPLGSPRCCFQGSAGGLLSKSRPDFRAYAAGLLPPLRLGLVVHSSVSDVSFML